MKPNDQYISNKAECPYYKRENRNVICCSGLLPNSSTHVAFGNAADCLKYKIKLCRDEYSRCRVYEMLEEAEDDQVS